MSLLEELKRFEDVIPRPMQGGGKEQPWLMPIYGVSAEMELIDWMYDWVRLLKPEIVVETGCHLGLTTYALGRACQDNGKGQVFTCDVNREYMNTTIARLAHGARYGQGILPVTVRLQSAVDMPEMLTADFAFLDSSYETRIPCLDLMKSGSIAIVHDTRQEPSLRAHPYPALHFDTWRGYSIVRKP